MSSWSAPGYAEERQLGRGASGRVVQAVHLESGHRVAIKYLAPELFADPDFLEAFREEADLLRGIDVPQVVRLFDYLEQPGRGAAIVMELVEGVSLHEMIKRQGPATPEAALVVLKGSLLGLAAAHSMGIVHRDYKPENVLVDSQGASKLSDFGVAVRQGRDAPAAGTPLYMAPEQWAGEPATPASDVYAASAVFFECLAGKTPFTGRIGQLREQHLQAPVPLEAIDQPLRPLVGRGMAKDPVSRPRSALHFLHELEDRALAAYGPDWEERGRSQLRERAAALLLLLLRRGTAAGSGNAVASTWLGAQLGRWIGQHKRTAAAAAAAAVIVLAGGISMGAVALSGSGSTAETDAGTAAAGHSAPATPAAPPSAPPGSPYQGVATSATPTVTAACLSPATFAFHAVITAAAPGTVSYRWAYSNGATGAVQSLTFTAPGTQPAADGMIQASLPGSGWAAIETTSPVELITNKAPFQLTCTTAGAGPGFSAAATVNPATKAVTCGSAPPSFTFSGTITATAAANVTYHWKLPGGNGPAQSLAFASAGTLTVAAPTVTAASDTASGTGEIVITSPKALTSNAAGFSVTCTGGSSGATGGSSSSGTPSSSAPSGGSPSSTAPSSAAPSSAAPSSAAPSSAAPSSAAPSSSAPVSTAPPSINVSVSSQSTTVSCNAAPPKFTVSGTITSSEPASVTYHWVLPDGTTTSPGTISVGASSTVATDYTPASVPSSGTVTLMVTSPASASGSATLTVNCVKPPAVRSESLPAAVEGASYSGSISAVNGTGDYTWSISGLPAGLTYTPTGATTSITGPVDAQPGVYALTVTVTDSSGDSTTDSALSITVQSRIS